MIYANFFPLPIVERRGILNFALFRAMRDRHERERIRMRTTIRDFYFRPVNANSKHERYIR